MTYQSKAALRKEIGHLQARLAEAKEELDIRASWKVIEDRASRNRNEAAVANATRETLELVIKALGIPDYSSTVYVAKDEYGIKVYDTDRFHADLETALRVRAEKKQEAEDAATEARVAELGKKDSGNTFSFSFIPTSGEYDATAPKLVDLSPETISKLDQANQAAMRGEGVTKSRRPLDQSETVEKIIKKSKGDKK